MFRGWGLVGWGGVVLSWRRIRARIALFAIRHPLFTVTLFAAGLVNFLTGWLAWPFWAGVMTVVLAVDVFRYRRRKAMGITRWWLYRLFTRHGALLYVGITSRPVEQRLEEHREDKLWWRFVDYNTVELLGRMTQGEAEGLELGVIVAEGPSENIKGNPHYRPILINGH